MIKQKPLPWAYIGLLKLASLIRYVYRLRYWDCFRIPYTFRIPIYRTKANFDFIFKFIQEMLNMWKWRGLTLIGKIEIVKSLIIPKILSKVAVNSVTDDLIQEINKKLTYCFIWNGTDKIKRSALINDIEDGGKKMLDIQAVTMARRVLIFKRYVDNKYESP